MTGLGTIVDAGAILLGSTLGLFLRRGLPEKWQESIMQAVSLCIIIIGIQMALKSENIIITIVSLVIGTIIGEWLDINSKLQKFGAWLGAKIVGKNTTGAAKSIGEGFVAASLIYCVGALAILGSLADGLKGDTTILYAKATLDFIISVILTANMGIGVAFSAASVLLYQGALTMLAGAVEPLLTESILQEITATGGVLIIAIGINTLKIIEIRISNLLPAIFMPLVLITILGLI